MSTVSIRLYILCRRKFTANSQSCSSIQSSRRLKQLTKTFSKDRSKSSLFTKKLRKDYIMHSKYKTDINNYDVTMFVSLHQAWYMPFHDSGRYAFNDDPTIQVEPRVGEKNKVCSNIHIFLLRAIYKIHCSIHCSTLQEDKYLLIKCFICYACFCSPAHLLLYVFS